MGKPFGRNRGLTLIELLVTLVLSGFLIAGLYRTFVAQHKTYIIQERVADLQQYMRAATSQMIRGIRMAGFGNVKMVLPLKIGTAEYWGVVNAPSKEGAAMVCVSLTTATIAEAKASETLLRYQIKVNRLKNGDDPLFDTGDKRYISIGGLESHTIVAVDEANKVLTLEKNVIYEKEARRAGTPVYPIRVTSYDGDFLKSYVDDIDVDRKAGKVEIEKVQYEYFDASGAVTTTPDAIRMMKVTVTAKQDDKDPLSPIRRREIGSNIQLRNLK